MNNLHYNIRITGKVQGVFYRASAITKAVELGISGFVRNELDNSVYIEAEGKPDRLDQFIDWCNEGSDFSKVDHVEIEEGGFQDFNSFEIKR